MPEEVTESLGNLGIGVKPNSKMAEMRKKTPQTPKTRGGWLDTSEEELAELVNSFGTSRKLDLDTTESAMKIFLTILKEIGKTEEPKIPSST